MRGTYFIIEKQALPGMKNKKVGFSGYPKPQGKDSADYYDILLPTHTVNTLNAEPGDLAKFEIRNQSGRTGTFNKKVSKAAGQQLKVYVPKPVVDELELSENELVDVFISKP